MVNSVCTVTCIIKDKNVFSRPADLFIKNNIMSFMCQTSFLFPHGPYRKTRSSLLLTLSHLMLLQIENCSEIQKTDKWSLAPMLELNLFSYILSIFYNYT